MPKARIIDVAREAGVSLGTVSNALNHPDKVRPETKKLIDEAIARLGYIPNQSARLLAGGSNAVLGLVLPRLDHGSCLQIASGAHAAAEKLGYSLLIAYAGGDNASTRKQLDYLMGIQVAGVIVQPADADAWETADNLPAPVVTVASQGRGRERGGHFVAADNATQGRVVTAHLVSRGASRIAVIGHASNQHMRLRLEGVREALADRPGIELEVIDAGEGSQSGDGFSLGRELARRPEEARPDAVLGLTDVLAAGALAGAQSAGLSVPEDLLVAGCDGNPFAWCGAVALTTCSPVGYELGRRSVQTLASLIEKQREEARTWHPERAGALGRATHSLDDAVLASADDGKQDQDAAMELVKPFLLARASTGAGTQAPGSNRSAIPELNIGAYI